MPRPAFVREHAPPLQPLLFWQVCLVCAVLGILALQWPQAALLGLGLLFWVDTRLHGKGQVAAQPPLYFPAPPPAQAPAYPQAYPPAPAPAHSPAKASAQAAAVCRIFLALACFAGAWSIGSALLPPPVELPPWAMRQPHTKELPRLRGVVENVQGLTDQRLRITLKDVTLDALSSSVTSPIQPDSPPPSPIGLGTARSPSLLQPNTADVLAPAPSLHGKVVWTWDNAPVRPLQGEVWTFTLPVTQATGFSNQGLADWSFAARTQNHLWRIWSTELRGNPQKLTTIPTSPTALQREALHQKLVSALRGEQDAASPLSQAQAILPALLFGDRSALSSETINLFTKATLIHSLALSGQHLGVTIVLASLLVSCLTRFFSLTFLWVPRVKAIVACALPLALLYLWLGNAPASLLRAACMMCILCICLWRNSSMTTLDILCGAVLCLLLWNPLSLYDVGLQLSVLCVGSIALVMPILRSLPHFPPPRRSTMHQPPGGLPSAIYKLSGPCRALASILLISCAIQIVLLPVSLLLFHTTSPWFFLNVLWLPVLGCVVLPAAVLTLAFATLHLPSLALLCAQIAIWPCDLLLRLLQWLHSTGLLDEILFLRPHWSALLGYAALLLAALLLWKRRGLPPACRRLALAGALLLLIGPLLRYAEQSSPNIRLRMLDVGQGLALALELPHGKSLLIDGGGSHSSRFDIGQAIVSPTLTYNYPPRVDSLINSHPHIDHLKGLLYLNKHFQVRQWHDSSTLAAGDSLLLQQQPRITLEVLHPPRNTRYPKENDNSLVLRLVAEGPNGPKGLALFTGDIEHEALEDLLSQGYNLQAEVLILPHHGSKTSLSPALYAAVNPKVALISYGRNNRYGSPAPQVIKALQERPLRIFHSAEHGQIQLEWNMSGGENEEAEGGFASLRLPPAGDASPAPSFTCLLGGWRRFF